MCFPRGKRLFVIFWQNYLHTYFGHTSTVELLLNSLSYIPNTCGGDTGFHWACANGQTSMKLNNIYLNFNDRNQFYIDRIM